MSDDPSDGGGLVARAVTPLFVPGDRPDRYAKAVRSGADVVIIDLEDAVESALRAAATEHALAALADPVRSGVRALVRVTDPSSPTHADELDRLAALARRPGHGLIGVVVPKAADASALATVIAAFAEPVPVVALVESAAGVQAARELARTPGIVRLAFGALDFSFDVGAELDGDTARYAEAQVVVASRAAGLPAPWASPCTELVDLAVVTAAARAARARGFGGQLCIHPAQLEPVRAGFAPTDAEREWAVAILGDGGDGVARRAGQMVDRPLLERARRILSSTPGGG